MLNVQVSSSSFYMNTFSFVTLLLFRLSMNRARVFMLRFTEGNIGQFVLRNVRVFTRTCTLYNNAESSSDYAYLLHGTEFFLRSWPVFGQPRNSPYFTEPEGSFPHSQMPANCPYSEPARSIPCSHIQFSKILLNIILPSTFGSSKLSLSLRFPHQSPVYTSPHNVLHAPPISFSRFYHPHIILWAVRIIKVLIMQFSPLPCHLVHLRPKYSPQYLVLKHPQPSSSLSELR